MNGGKNNFNPVLFLLKIFVRLKVEKLPKNKYNKHVIKNVTLKIF